MPLTQQRTSELSYDGPEESCKVLRVAVAATPGVEAAGTGTATVAATAAEHHATAVQPD